MHCRLSGPDILDKGHDVPPVATPIAEAVHQLPNEVNPETSDRPLFDRRVKFGMGRSSRIVIPGIVCEFDHKSASIDPNCQFDPVPVRVVIAITDRVGKQLVDRHVNGIGDLGRHA